MSQASLSELQSVEQAPLFLALGLLASSLIREVYPDLYGPETRPLSPAERYVRDSLLVAGNLLWPCEQMELAAQNLSGFRKPRRLGAYKITRLDHVYYHLENHLLRATMLTDRALQFTNVICALGLPKSECRISTVIDNSHVKNKPIAQAFYQLNVHLKPLRETRNILLHRHRLRDAFFDKVDEFFLLEKIGSPDSEARAPLMKRITDKVLRERRAELDRFNSQAFSLVRRLLDAGESAFSTHHAAILSGRI